jgi:NAD(P)-dependent dehydrogenase (short-subunit alcohol dehydrogenase family)
VFGGCDALVNNAGVLRDKMFVNMSPDDWDAVINGHLRTTFAMSRVACAHWRDRSKAGEEVSASIVNTSSTSGLIGSVGQSNYGAAKAAIAAMTVIVAQEMSRYGVRVNAISPAARTRMTADP